MDNEKEISRHKKIMDSIRNAKCKEDIPNVSLSNIAGYLASNVYFDDRHISQSLFKPVVDMVVDYGFFGMPQVRDVFIKVLKENYPDKSEDEYIEKYNLINKSHKITNIIIEVSERMAMIQKFQDEEDLINHKNVLKDIDRAYNVKDLPNVGLGELNRRIQRSFNSNDFIKNIKVSSFKDITDAYMEGKSIKEIDSLVYDYCDKLDLSKDNRQLMYSQVIGSLNMDKVIRYLASEIKAKEERKLKIYKINHEDNMEVIKEATRISQLPPNLTESTLTSYLSGNSIIFVKGSKISTLDLKKLTSLLLSGKRWEDKEVNGELKKICYKYYSDDLEDKSMIKGDVAYKLLYDKFSKLPKTYYLVEEINACNKRIKEFTASKSSNVNVYFIPNNKGPIDGGRFYNCYINRVNNLDLGELLPLDLGDIVPPEMDIDSVEWFIQEYYDKTFKVAGGIILNKDETIGNVSVFRPNDGKESISKEEKDSYEELSDLYDRVNELFRKRNEEQAKFLKSQSSFLKNKSEIDKQLNELNKKIVSLNNDVKKNFSRKKEK